ncbi:hypothetical protein BDZ45DRAFT_754061 [Acephala macrosclerotiorum]|nr:hypothetical protein BDZ45DRAFT_754061 [Acephala macrosclerotiorum]
MATQEIVNVFDPQLTRYITKSEELEGILVEKYGEEAGFTALDFKVFHENDRWLFVLPRKLSKIEMKNISLEIAAKRDPPKLQGKESKEGDKAES